jgi:predicted GIY-YIG superfamily endonuclease
VRKKPEKNNSGDVYLLHFSPAYKHAAHYLGFAEPGNFEKRIQEHREKRGAHLTKVAVLAGCELIFVKLWRNKTRRFERRLKKRQYGSIFNICPLCRRTNGTTGASLCLTNDATNDNFRSVTDEVIGMSKPVAVIGRGEFYECNTVAEAEDYIETVLRRRDPQGVADGSYSIDAPYQFADKPAAKSSTSVAFYRPNRNDAGKINL